eukprot:3936376-Alexandrium_andersonii.AAC.1
MSASLVGSEMCIRDSRMRGRDMLLEGRAIRNRSRLRWECPPEAPGMAQGSQRRAPAARAAAIITEREAD